jgi:putative ABC transport system permease protein
MYYIKALIHSINKKSLSVFLIWIQFSLIFSISFILVDSFFGLYRNENEKRQSISAGFDRCCPLIINTISDSKKTFEDAAGFLSEIKKLDELETLGNFFDYGTSFSSLRGNNAFSEAVNNALEGEKIENKKRMFPINDEIYDMMRNNLEVEILSVDYGLFNSLISNQLIEGKKPDKAIFKSDGFVPVILGYVYKDAFNIGDTFESDNGLFKCRVIGKLKKNSKWLNLDASNELSSELSNIDYNIIVLTNGITTYFDTPLAGTVLMNNYIISKEPFDSTLKSKICQVAENYGFSVGIYTLNDYFKSTRENNMERSSLKLFSIIFLSIIAVFGLASIIVYSINNSRREIGVRIACGAGTRHIIFIFFAEIFLITLAAFLTSCIVVNSESLLDILRVARLRNLGMWVYIITFVISLVTCIASCVFPIKRILKLEPRELTGGNE